MFLGYIDPGTGFTIFGAGAWLIAFFLGLFGILALFLKRIFRFLKKHKKIVVIIILILTLLGLTVRGVIMYKYISKFDKRVIILGFDAVSPEIIEPMMKIGELPNFTRLRNTGSYKHLATTNPSQSPVAWTGMATGKNPGKNGVFDFIVRDPQTYRLDLSLSKIEKGRSKRISKTKCLWQYTSDFNAPTIILNFPVTFPPDKIYGRMLSGMGVPDILGTEGTFTFYTSEVLEKEKHIGGKVFSIKKSPVMVIHFIGPKVAKLNGKTEQVKVPFKCVLKDANSVIIEYQKNKLGLKVGQWSDWQRVTFNLGVFRNIKGIFKFYLVETAPQFKLYISPINFDPQSPFFPVSYPKSYSRELADAMGLYYTQGMPADTWAVNEGRLSEEAFLQQADEIFREQKAKLDFELSRFKKGVLCCYFESLDIIQHMFWRHIDSEHPLYEKSAPQKYKDMIRNWYRKMDDVLGSVLDRLYKEDILIVLSDHGFSTFRRAAHVNSWLRDNGYLYLKNPYAESGEEMLADIDWSKTKAYAIGFGAIYINQRNREQNGIVSLGSETEDLKEEISKKLEKWIDEKYNEPIINKVYKRQEIFFGSYAEDTPDLYIGFNKGYRASWQTALGGVPKELTEDNLKKWSGDHLVDPRLIPGVVFINKSITKDSPSIYDITPTVLKIIGYDDKELKENDFDGEPLF